MHNNKIFKQWEWVDNFKRIYLRVNIHILMIITLQFHSNLAPMRLKARIVLVARIHCFFITYRFSLVLLNVFCCSAVFSHLCLSASADFIRFLRADKRYPLDVGKNTFCDISRTYFSKLKYYGRRVFGICYSIVKQ